MIKYTLRRILQSIPTLFGITLLAYILMSAAPGGPVEALTSGPQTTPQQRQRVAAQLGVNDPFPIQYLRWLLGDDWMRRDTNGDGIADQAILIPLDADGDGEPELPGRRQGILRGDFGRSFFFRRPVMDMIGERVAATLELGSTALLIGLMVGLPVGILAAVYKSSWFDNATRIMSVVVSAIPIFWLGLILILLFSVTLPRALGLDEPILPMSGRCPRVLLGGCPPIYQRIEHILLPAFVLSSFTIAAYSRYMRASMLDVKSQDYMRTAHAKGLSPRKVWFFHGARNALIPLATFLGPALTGLLSGAAITETIFSWPGLGSFAVNAVTQQDYPVVMAVVIITAVATILGFILSDILYVLIDPRIRFN